MKLQVVSDLHVDQWAQRHGVNWWRDFLRELRTVDSDILVVAGDCFSLKQRDLLWTRARLAELCDLWEHVVYVPGNHEFYGTSIGAGNMELQVFEARLRGLYILRTGYPVTIKGRRFLGDTMWVPPTNAPPISDSWCISGFEEDAHDDHEKLCKFLFDQLRAGDIVVTHHAPSNRSLAVRWLSHPCNPWFIAPHMEEYIIKRAPALWIHGHTHTPVDYTIDTGYQVKTRVVCNPLGYPDEGVHFKAKVVELP